MSTTPSRHGSADIRHTHVDRVARALRRRRRGGRRYRAIRRGLAIALLVTAGALAMAARPGTPAGTSVVAVTRDLPVGATLQASDLATTHLRAAPHGAITTAAAARGHILSGPMRAGEVLTDARMVSTHGLDAGPGRAAVPVHPDDAATVALLTTGMHVAVIGVNPAGSARTLSDDAVVLWVADGSRPPAGPAGTSGDRLVVLAVPQAVADAVATTAITGTIGLRFL